MTDKQRDEILLEALIKAGVTEALENEMREIPPEEELRELYQLSPDFDARIAAVIKKECRKYKTSGLKKKVATAAVAVLLLAGSFLSVDAARNAIFNTVLEWKGKYTQIQFSEDIQDAIFRPTYLPAQYSEALESHIGDTVMLDYDNGISGKIIFKQSPATDSSALVNNENVSYEEITVNGAQAFFFQSEESGLYSILLWQSEGVLFELNATVERAETIRIAESVKK